MADGTNPPASSTFVLDGSVALSWCFPDERGGTSQGLLDALGQREVVVPTLWFLEVSNALISAERRGRLTPAESGEALHLLGQLPLHIDDRSGLPFASEIVALARHHSLTTYDATYLELALRLGLPLATLDRRLQKAAKAAGVPLAAG